MGKDLRYSISDCFETFPVPPEGELEDGSLIDRVGKVLYERRASYLEELNVGLGKAYNILKDPCFKGGPEVELRGLHEELDRAVLAAYGWDDIEVPPFTSAATGGERRAYAAFREEVLRRLFDLNALRGEKSPQLEF